MNKFVPAVLLATLIFAVSCKHKEETSVSITSDATPRLQISGQEIVRFDPLTCQLSSNRNNAEFTIIKDDGSGYLYVKLDKIPETTGEKVECTLGWAWQKKYEDNKKVTLNTEKIEGHVLWLWNDSSKTGVVIECLE